MTKNKLCIVYTTAPSLQCAISLINIAMKNKLAACANIIKNGKSYYIWDEKLKSKMEVFIIFKTTCNKSTELSEFILKEHTYRTPAILIWSVMTSDNFYEYVTYTIS